MSDPFVAVRKSEADAAIRKVAAWQEHGMRMEAERDSLSSALTAARAEIARLREAARSVPTEAQVEAAARAMAKENGDDFDSIPVGKAEWTHAQGKFGGRYRDINEPMRSDYLSMARAALEAARNPAALAREEG